MGVPLDQVVVRLGDSSLPAYCGSGGQRGSNNSTAGVYAACTRLREAVAKQAGFAVRDAVFADGQVRVGSRAITLLRSREQQWVINRQVEERFVSR